MLFVVLGCRCVVAVAVYSLALDILSDRKLASASASIHIVIIGLFSVIYLLLVAVGCFYCVLLFFNLVFDCLSSWYLL